MKSSLYFYCLIVFLLGLLVQICGSEDRKETARDRLKGKDVRDYSDVDIEDLYDQWEEQEEPLEEDELPEWKRPSPQIDLSKLDLNDPEQIMKMTKKGKTVMMFASLSGNPKESETEQISLLWQTSLHNAHYDIQRYIVGQGRVLFVVKDGSMAWDIKNYLVQQESCSEVSLEGKDYKGKGATLKEKPSKEKKSQRTDL